MTDWIALSRTEHAQAAYIARSGYSFAADLKVIPVLLAELAKLMPHYVLAFAKDADVISPVALVGLPGQDNLYVNHEGKWLAAYVPSALRGYPFRLLPTASDGDKEALCIEQKNLVQAGEGLALFENDGELAEPVKKTLDFLTQCAANRKATLTATAALQSAGVLAPWPLKIAANEGETPVELQGLWRVDETALNKLPAETFADLRKGGALALAYSQMLAGQQLTYLGDRARYRAAQMPPAEVDLETLFGDGDDELIFS